MGSPAYSGPERRKVQRLRRSFLVQYRLREERRSRLIGSGNAWAYDLCTDGMRLHTLGPLPCSTTLLRNGRVQIDCQVTAQDGQDAWLTGRPVWIASPTPAHGDDAHQTFYLGLAFSHEPGAGPTIAHLLSQHPVPSNPTREQLASLLELSHLLTSAVDLDHLLYLILQTANRLMCTNACSLLLVDPLTNELVFKVPVGPASELLKEIRLQPGQGIAGWVVKERRPVLVNDVSKDPRFDRKVDQSTGFRTKSILAVPLQDRGRVLGVIEVLNTAKEKQFEQVDLDLLSAFAAHASVALRNAQLVSTIREENRYLQGELEERYKTLIGESAAMRDAVALARKVAEAQATVLLLGESGVGKEIVARSIHAWSPRASKPFLAVNCVALSDHLLESELFGHEKGAFTGAHQLKKGLFEVAHGGTVFLDEIGEMKPELQAKLLRVLQDHEFERVGGTHPIRVDIRIIAATNQDLHAAVKAGRFRKDLFYRLNVVTIALPPLRERKEDILPLATFFLKRFRRELMRPPMTLSREAITVLQRHDWPGNVRELENVIERAVVLAVGDTIQASDIALGVASLETAPAASLLDLPFHESINAHKRALIRHAIDKAGGSKGKAALALKLQPTYLSRLCRQLGIS
ncbi:MAG: sigma 54-interacting transcriptional regulator [Nitrospirota bacterium]